MLTARDNLNLLEPGEMKALVIFSITFLLSTKCYLAASIQAVWIKGCMTR